VDRDFILSGGVQRCFLLLLIWVGIGSFIYVFTQEQHRMHRRIEKQHRKEKDKADRKLVKDLMEKTEEKMLEKEK